MSDTILDELINDDFYSLKRYKDEFGDTLAELEELGFTDKDLADLEYRVQQRANPATTLDSFFEEFIDEDNLLDLPKIFQAQGRQRALVDQYRQAKTQEERDRIGEQLVFETRRKRALQEGPLENFLAFIPETLAISFAPFAKGALVGGQLGAAAGPGGSGVGAIVGGTTTTAWDSYNIWQAENLARALEQEDAEATPELLEKATQGAYWQAGLEAVANLVGARALGKLGAGIGKDALEASIKKEMIIGALAGGSTEAVAQGIQRAVVPGLDPFDSEGAGEILAAGLAGALFGGALGGVSGAFAKNASQLKDAADTGPDKDPVKAAYELVTGYKGSERKPVDFEQSFKQDQDAVKSFVSDKANLLGSVNYQKPRKNIELYELQAKMESVLTRPEQRLALRRMSDKQLIRASQEPTIAKNLDDYVGQVKTFARESAFRFGDELTTKPFNIQKADFVVGPDSTTTKPKRVRDTVDTFLSPEQDVIVRDVFAKIPDEVLTTIRKAPYISKNIKKKFTDILDRKTQSESFPYGGLLRAVVDDEPSAAVFREVLSEPAKGETAAPNLQKAAKALGIPEGYARSLSLDDLQGKVFERLVGMDDKKTLAKVPKKIQTDFKKAMDALRVIRNSLGNYTNTESFSNKYNAIMENVPLSFSEAQLLGEISSINTPEITNQKKLKKADLQNLGIENTAPIPVNMFKKMTPEEALEAGIDERAVMLDVVDTLTNQQNKESLVSVQEGINAFSRLKNFLGSTFLSPSQVAQTNKAVARVMSFFETKLNTISRFSSEMGLVQQNIRNHFKGDTTRFNSAHNELVNARKNKATLKDLSEDARILDDYYKYPVKTLYKILDDKVKLIPETERTKPHAYVKEREHLKELLDKPYVPFRRFGGIFVKVGDGVYSLEERKLGKILFQDGTRISKDEWDSLRKRVKEETGVTLTEKPKFETKPGKGKDIEEGVLYKPTYSDIKSSDLLKGVAQDAAVFNYLSEHDPNLARLLKEMKEEKNVDLLKRIFKTSREVEGYSDDWDRVFESHTARMPSLMGQIMFGDSQTQLRTNVANDDYARNLFDYQLSDNALEGIARQMSATLAFSGNLSTPLIQLTAAISTSPTVMGLYNANFYRNVGSLTKYYAKAGKFLDFGERNNKVLDTKSIEKEFGKPFADFVRRNPDRIANSIQQDVYMKSAVKRGEQTTNLFKQLYTRSFVGLRETEIMSRLGTGASIMNDMQNPKYLATAIRKLSKDEKFNELRKVMNDADAVTAYLIDASHATYGDIGRAKYQRTFVGATLAPFTTFLQRTFETYVKAATGQMGFSGLLSALQMAGVMSVLFGIKGTPYYQIMAPLYELYEKYVLKINGLGPQKAVEDELLEMGFSRSTIDKLMTGAVGAANVDISERVGVTLPWAFIGDLALGGVGAREGAGFIPTALNEFIAGQTMEQKFQALAPTAARNLYQAGKAQFGEGTTSRSGEVALPSNSVLPVVEPALKAIGITPTRWNETSKYKYYQQFENGAIVTELRKAALRDAVKAVQNNDRQGVERALYKFAKQKIKVGREFTKEDEQRFMRDLQKYVANREYGALAPRGNVSKENRAKYAERLAEIQGR